MTVSDFIRMQSTKKSSCCQQSEEFKLIIKKKYINYNRGYGKDTDFSKYKRYCIKFIDDKFYEIEDDSSRNKSTSIKLI